MKTKTRNFLLNIINAELLNEQNFINETQDMFEHPSKDNEEYIKGLLSAKIDLLSEDEGLNRLINQYDITEDLKKFGYTMKDLKN